MKTLLILIIIASLTVGITIGISFNAYAQTTSNPTWLKKTALWWGQGQVSDDEFIKAIQWMIDNKILVVSQSSTLSTNNHDANTVQQSSPSQQNDKPSFSGTVCKRDEVSPTIIHYTGKFTNGAVSYDFVYLQLGIIDSNGNVVATGNDMIDNIGPYQTKIFDATAIYSGDFAKCEIEIGNVSP